MDRQIVEIDTVDLDFDPENPRFYKAANMGGSSSTAMDRMIKLENIQELMGSIGEQGYFDGEPLLVAPSPVDGQKLIVVEGNRRLAALKLLNGEFEPHSFGKSIKELQEIAKYKPKKVACVVFNERREILRYLGYRHISGAKRWDPLAKARYLNQLRESFYSEMSTSEQLKALAREIGSRTDYVAQMLTGLNVYECAKDKLFFGLQHISEENVEFSLLTTALSYSNIAKYIGLSSRTDIEANDFNENNAKDLFSWLFAQNQNGETIVGESRNLKLLAAVVDNQPAIKALKSGSSLKEAYIYTEGPSTTFLNSLEHSIQSLKKSFELMTTVDIFGDEHKIMAEKIENIVEPLVYTIKSRVKKQARED